MSAAYSPPPVAQDGIELTFEPARFSRTGAGLLKAGLVRDEFYADAQAYSLDAPPYLPAGGVDSFLHVPSGLNVNSQLRPWHYLGTSVPREHA